MGLGYGVKVRGKASTRDGNFKNMRTPSKTPKDAYDNMSGGKPSGKRGTVPIKGKC